MNSLTLWLVRHALAVEVSLTGRDEDRELSPDGISIFKEFCARHVPPRRAGVSPLFPPTKTLAEPVAPEFMPMQTWGGIKLLSSPLIRARQTADLLSQHLDLTESSPEVLELLSPGVSAERFWKFLKGQSADDLIICVGHEPDLSRISGGLMGGARIKFYKGGIACLKVDPKAGDWKSAGTLQWYLSPKTYASEDSEP